MWSQAADVGFRHEFPSNWELPMRPKFLNAVLFSIILIAVAPIHAQFTTNYQTNVISGVVNWGGTYIVGSKYSHDILIITNGATLSANTLAIGTNTTSIGNVVYVMSGGTLIATTPNSLIGVKGAGQLIISNSTVQLGTTYIGGYGGTGTLTMNGGTATFGIMCIFGNDGGGGQGVGTVSNGFLSATGSISIGGASTGQLSLVNSTLLVPTVIVGGANGGAGTVVPTYL